jgi:hypothetical protein
MTKIIEGTRVNDYAALPDHKLATLPGVRRITSTIVMKRIVDNRPLPLPATPEPPDPHRAGTRPDPLRCPVKAISMVNHRVRPLGAFR